MIKMNEVIVVFILLQVLSVSVLAVPNILSAPDRIKRWEVDCPIEGCKGQKGARGSPGPIGNRGYAGMGGPPGQCNPNFCFEYIQRNLPPPIQFDPISGEKGEKGMPGPAGTDGNPGAPGDSGLPGEKGMEGPPGSNGEPGVPGEAGRKGFPGPPGPLGPIGMKGDPGEQGMKGVPGEPGPAGEAGQSGRTGPPGKTGLPGAPGDSGEPGKDGVDGLKGEKGMPGPPIDVIPQSESGPCTLALQGVIRFDPFLNKLYFCNGSKWICLENVNCGGPITCPSPYGPQAIGNQWYQVFVRNVTQDTQDAADIVLVVDESGSMINEQRWLLVMVPFLENILTSAGVGDGETRNRYCLIGFGSFVPFRSAHFRDVDGMRCYPASDFPRAQAQLLTAGVDEDGYEAIQFALDNVPFRNSPFIAKNILLITDEGRRIIPEGEDITRDSLEEEIKSQDALLNVIVMADYELADQPEAMVFGVDADGLSYVLQPGGAFSVATGDINVVMPETNTREAYVELALAVGGASWALRILRNSSLEANQDLQNSFTSALAEVKLNEIRASVQSCRRCSCVAGESDSGAKVDCVIADDDQFCRCVVDNAGDASQCTRNTFPQIVN